MISEMLLPLMMSDNTEVLTETVRVFGNFSQVGEVRKLLCKSRSLSLQLYHFYVSMLFSADELLVVLLGHTNREVVFLSCGVLINLVAEEHCHAALQNGNGVRVLLEVSLITRPMFQFNTHLIFLAPPDLRPRGLAACGADMQDAVELCWWTH